MPTSRLPAVSQPLLAGPQGPTCLYGLDEPLLLRLVLLQGLPQLLQQRHMRLLGAHCDVAQGRRVQAAMGGLAPVLASCDAELVPAGEASLLGGARALPPRIPAHHSERLHRLRAAMEPPPPPQLTGASRGDPLRDGSLFSRSHSGVAQRQQQQTPSGTRSPLPTCARPASCAGITWTWLPQSQ